MSGRLCNGLFVITLLVWAVTAVPAYANTSVITRQDIQTYLKQPGNALMSSQWRKDYQNKVVEWQGVVYQVSVWDETGPAEVLLRVLPTSRLYDTVLLIPLDHPWVSTLRPGQTIRFQGVVSGGVDTFFLKEVHVTLYNQQPEQPQEPVEAVISSTP